MFYWETDTPTYICFLSPEIILNHGDVLWAALKHIEQQWLVSKGVVQLFKTCFLELLAVLLHCTGGLRRVQRDHTLASTEGFHLYISQKNLRVDLTTVMLSASLRSDHDVVFMYVCMYIWVEPHIYTHTPHIKKNTLYCNTARRYF